MRVAILALLATLLFAATAIAQDGGTIGLYTDPIGIDCNIMDWGQGLIDIYVVHKTTMDVIASQWAAPLPACMGGAVFLAFDGLCPIIGCPDPIGGDWFYYGDCYTGIILVGVLKVFGLGITTSCCEYPVLPDPDVASGQVEVWDCDQNVFYGLGRVSIVNSVPSCPCQTVGVDETTWGRVKALYVD